MSKKMKLGEIGEIVSGSTPKTNIKEYWNGDILWVTPAEIQEDDYYIADTQRKITNLAVEKTNLKLLPKGTVLLSSRAPIGKVAICDNDMYCNQGFKNIICSDRIENRYVYYFLKHNVEYIKSLGRGATFKEISKGIVENLEIPYREKKEQIEIANKLDKITEILKIRKQQIKQFDEIIKSQFVEMFEGEKYTKIKLGEEFEISSGGTPSKNKDEYWNSNDISWIGSNMCQNKIIYENDGKYISNSGLEHSSAKIYPIDTILVALVGATIGKTALLKFETATNQNIAGIQVNKKFNAEYVFFAIQNLYYKFAELSKGTFKMANLSFVRNLEIPMPPIELQKQFAEIVKQIDKQKFEIENSLKEMQELYESLMEKYFG